MRISSFRAIPHGYNKPASRMSTMCARRVSELPILLRFTQFKVFQTFHRLHFTAVAARHRM